MAAIALAVAACGRDDDGANAAPRTPAAASGPLARPQRLQDPDLALLRDRIDAGHVDEARALLAELRGRIGVEGRLLDARLETMLAHDLEAARAIERAREEAPADPRVYATAAEINAARGRFETGWAELRRGMQVCGDGHPEFDRARGVLWIARSGGTVRGVAALEAALAADPELPFLGRPLGQGYLLLAKQALATGDLARALSAVRRSLEFDPEEIDARRLLSDGLAANGDFAEALEVLEGLAADGVPLGSELALTYKRAGMADLLMRDRAGALEHFRHARRHGLTDAELGTGARLLAEEAGRAVEQGNAALAASDWERAAQRFERALALDPERIEAHNHLAVAAYRLGDAQRAAEHWRRVLAIAREEGLELPEPVHVNLAKALVRAGDEDGARIVLEEYLDREPGGTWTDTTRELLAELSR